jgi:2-keto-4-pentenoate hydratase/2-oxohepta-3-ene-1,7-dioic acid hydratase in catechol pathway
VPFKCNLAAPLHRGGGGGSFIRHHAASAAAGTAASVVDPGPPPPVALVSFTRAKNGAVELGLVENGQWLWAIPSDKYPGGMAQLIEQWFDAGGAEGVAPADALERERRGDPVPLASVALLPPLPAPTSIVCVGKNYLEHVGEVDTNLPGICKAEVPEVPLIFTKAPTSVVGHQGGIVFPAGVSDQVDYEGELGVVIGRRGAGISREEAYDYIFGYTIINDVTARDVQKRHQQWYLGKSFDTFCPIGPWIVPKRALGAGGDPQRLDIGTTVNGARRQGSNTAKMIFDIPTLIETVSRCMTLQPGDVIATGTPAGVGAGMTPKGFLKVGDVCEVTVQGVGTLSNKVV